MDILWHLISQPHVVDQILSADPPPGFNAQHIRRLQHIVDHLQGAPDSKLEEVEEVDEVDEVRRHPILSDWPRVSGSSKWAPILSLASLQTPLFFDRIITNYGANLRGARVFIRGSSIEYDDWMRSQTRRHTQGDAINAMSHLVHNLDHQVAQNRVVYGFTMIIHHEIGLALRSKDTHTGMFTKKMRAILTRIFLQIEPSTPAEAIEKRVSNIALWAKKGHHLRVLTDWYGMGILFFLADLLTLHDFERLIPKSGYEFEAAAHHLYELKAPNVCESSKANALAHFVIQDMMAPFIETMTNPPRHLVSENTSHAAPWLEFPVQRSGSSSKLATDAASGSPALQSSNSESRGKPSPSKPTAPASAARGMQRPLASANQYERGGFPPAPVSAGKTTTLGSPRTQCQLASPDPSEPNGPPPIPLPARKTTTTKQASNTMTLASSDTLERSGFSPSASSVSRMSTTIPGSKRKPVTSFESSERHGFPPSSTPASRTSPNEQVRNKKIVTSSKAAQKGGRTPLGSRS
ncbi:hypothetical protein BLS_002918 [Venturia inaequalis]|uniref:Uncharacterized protein n=1 Tax=Venturia inaequalis TaxID=5025 RepID=A0A8H3YWS5_VENIN|nr:hypothetical protein BLS_002918 [Venturia inaequalis]KAE9977331.1 hypothetical protein EG327_007770 [Venturia inaequalis]